MRRVMKSTELPSLDSCRGCDCTHGRDGYDDCACGAKCVLRYWDVPRPPHVGQGATICLWSDRHAATVVAVPNDRTVVVRQDHAERVDSNGFSETQVYRYSPSPTTKTETFTLRKNGRWIAKGQKMRGGVRLGLGHRDEHYDFSF